VLFAVGDRPVGAGVRALALAAAAKLAERLTRSVLGEVREAGHSCHSDNPAGFLAVIQPFLATVFGR